MGFIRVEEVEVARAEDGGVEDLGDKGDTLGGSIAVDGEDKNELGQEMGDVSRVAEDLLATG